MRKRLKEDKRERERERERKEKNNAKGNTKLEKWDQKKQFKQMQPTWVWEGQPDTG